MELSKYPKFPIFEEGLAALGIQLTDKMKQQFIDYYELLIEWNEKMNLTAITEFEEVISKHFIDSLSLIKLYTPSKEKILDIGTGAGFPGIPLKIVFPDTDMVLLDSLNKRIVFLNEVITRLQLSNITAIHGRAEDYGNNIKYREQFDICVSRAVAKLSSLAEYCIPFIKKGGHFIPYKAGNIEEELELSQKAVTILGGEIKKHINFVLPGTDMERTLIDIVKISGTPKKYPRAAGKPSKEPLS